MVTQQFHETLEPLSEWLGATEKRLINSEPIGTETSKLDDQISQHKVRSLIFCQKMFFILFICVHFLLFYQFLFFHYICVHFLFCFFFAIFCLLPISVVRP